MRKINPQHHSVEQTTDSKLKFAYLACLITAVGIAVVYGFQSFYLDSIETFSNIISPLIAGIAVFSSFYALKIYWINIQSQLSRIWLCFTIGTLLWFFGELGWAVYTFVLNVEIPYPSILDAFWLSGYVPLFVALLLYVPSLNLQYQEKCFF